MSPLKCTKVAAHSHYSDQTLVIVFFSDTNYMPSTVIKCSPIIHAQYNIPDYRVFVMLSQSGGESSVEKHASSKGTGEGTRSEVYHDHGIQLS